MEEGLSIDFTASLNWLCTMTPDKLCFVFPLVIAYVICRTRALNNNWIWPVGIFLGAIIFAMLGAVDPNRTLVQNWFYRFLVGGVVGAIASAMSLGTHSLAFKALASKYPLFQFLVLNDEDNKTTPQDAAKPKDT